MFRMTEAEYRQLFPGIARPKKNKSVIPGIVSELEEEMDFQIKAIGLNGFTRQHKFHPDRDWMLDFYRDGWGIEINGGGWNRGGHNRNPIAMWKDYEKYNTCQEMGIKLLLFTGDQVKDGTAIVQVERIFK